jgi:hypothetical protein
MPVLYAPANTPDKQHTLLFDLRFFDLHQDAGSKAKEE